MGRMAQHYESAGSLYQGQGVVQMTGADKGISLPMPQLTARFHAFGTLVNAWSVLGQAAVPCAPAAFSFGISKVLV